MTAAWQSKKLGELCNFERGLTYAKGDEVEFSRNIVLRATNIDLATNLLDLSELRYISNEVKVPDSKKVKKNSLMICTASGSKSHLGKIAYIDKDYGFAFGGFMGMVTPKNGLVPKYLFYLMTSPEYKGFISELADGANINNLKFDQLRTFELLYPEPTQQERIVGILDEVFDGIAIAKRNAEENLQNARNLFESHLQTVFSERASGWQVKTVAELVRDDVLFKPFDGNHGEIHPKKTDYVGAGVPFIMASNLENGEVDTQNCKFLSRKLADSLRVGFAKDGDVLLSHKATIGRSAVLSTREDFVMLTPQVTAYRVKDASRLFNRFIRYYFMSPVFQREMIAAAEGGATRAYIGITKQLALRFRFPALQAQKEIATQCDSLAVETDRLVAIYEQKIAALEELKKSLLHQVFTGQLTQESAEPVPDPFPARIANITTTDLHAGILAIAYQFHEKRGKLATFGHIKAEKIAHMVEAHVGIDLGRSPIKDAAGPNDYPHLMRVEHRAKKAGFFSFARVKGSAYRVTKHRGFNALVERTCRALGERQADVNDLLQVMLKMDTQQAEIFSTVYAAWNNLLLDRQSITDDKIVLEARDNWHPEKLNIPRENFLKAIKWMREKNFVPLGRGKKAISKAK